MHFQTPPHDHAKLVHCAGGSIFDVVVDLRRSSPTYSRALTFELDSRAPSALYLAPGLAHGFCALEDNSLTVYSVTSEYNQSADSGIHWLSVPVKWPVSPAQAIMSPRDAAFPPLSAFDTPFTE
jgi:dTDP-4-dehydrorhamnose 3,5-epimerase